MNIRYYFGLVAREFSELRLLNVSCTNEDCIGLDISYNVLLKSWSAEVKWVSDLLFVPLKMSTNYF